MPTNRSARTGGGRAGAKTNNDDTLIVPSDDQGANLEPAVELDDHPAGRAHAGWYINQYIHESPDWAHQWVADRIDDLTETVKAEYRTLVDDLYGHPDRERGSALAWQLHDTVKGAVADRAWRRLHPDGIGNAERQFIRERVALKARGIIQ